MRVDCACLYTMSIHICAHMSNSEADLQRAEVSAVYLPCAMALYRLFIGIADGMSIARVWACRYSK